MSQRSQSRRRQEYFQEHWEEFTTSVAPSVSNEPELTYQERVTHPSSIAAPVVAMRKKKSHGNRRFQRKRAKLRRQGLSDEAISRLIHPTTNQPSVPVAAVRQEPTTTTVATKATAKRKRVIRPAGLPVSTSQVTIAPPAKKRARPITATTHAGGGIRSPENTTEPTAAYQPDYLKVSDPVFAKMLKDSLNDADWILEWLTTTEKFKFTRDYAQLINDLFFLRLKQDYWERYYRITMDPPIWPMALPRKILKENNLHRIQFVNETNIQKHRQRVVEQLNHVTSQLDRHKQMGLEQGIEVHKLDTIIPAFVRRGQQKLSAEFERKKILLQWDTQDYWSIKAFYDLNPTDDQINSAKLIWQTTLKKQQQENHVAILKQRIFTRRLPASFNVLDHSIDGTEQLLRQPGFHEDKRASLSDQRQKTIAQFKYDLMKIQIAAAEELVKSHADFIAQEKKKLVDSAQGQTPLPKSLVLLLNAISARQNKIVRRLQYLGQRTLSFFDDAPTVIDEAGTVGAI